MVLRAVWLFQVAALARVVGVLAEDQVGVAPEARVVVAAARVVEAAAVAVEAVKVAAERRCVQACGPPRLRQGFP